MVMKPEPVFERLNPFWTGNASIPAGHCSIILLTPQGASSHSGGRGFIAL